MKIAEMMKAKQKKMMQEQLKSTKEMAEILERRKARCEVVVAAGGGGNEGNGEASSPCNMFSLGY
jgi:hypothetical protein